MEAGKDDEEGIAPQRGEESVAQTGTQHGDGAAAAGEQGITPIPSEGTAAPEGPEQETSVAAQEGEAGPEIAQARQEEVLAGEANERPSKTAKDPAALLLCHALV